MLSTFLKYETSSILLVIYRVLPLKLGKDPKEDKPKDPKEDKTKDPKRGQTKRSLEDK